MKIKLVGKNLEEIRPKLAKFDLHESDNDFEVVISYGGDGALLGAARDFINVPKFPLRDYGTAPQCSYHQLEKRLENFASGKMPLTELKMLSGSVNGETLYALNDIFLQHYDLAAALRYSVRIDGELYAAEVLGDGVGMASVHGSSAYYRSITHSVFKVGIGLAFSNSTEEIGHLVLAESSVVELEVIRGPGILVADNSPERPIVNVGDVVVLKQSDQVAQIYGLKEFMCPQCRKLRHRGKEPFTLL